MDSTLASTRSNAKDSCSEGHLCRESQEIGSPLSCDSLSLEPRPQSAPVPESMPSPLPPCRSLHETAHLSDGMRIIARELIEMNTGLLLLCDTIRKLIRKSSGQALDADDHVLDEDIYITGISTDCAICQFERETRPQPEGLEGDFHFLAQKVSDTFTELLNVYTVAREIQDPKTRVHLYKEINNLYQCLYLVKSGVTDIHQDLADAGVHPQALEKEIDDRGKEFRELLAMEAARRHQSAHGSFFDIHEDDDVFDTNSHTCTAKSVTICGKIQQPEHGEVKHNADS